MSETPEAWAERVENAMGASEAPWAPHDSLGSTKTLAKAVAARDLSQRISGACDLALALGWSTGHGESMEALIEESRDNLRRERARVIKEAAAIVESFAVYGNSALPAAEVYRNAVVENAAAEVRARAAAEREGKA